VCAQWEAALADAERSLELDAAWAKARRDDAWRTHSAGLHLRSLACGDVKRCTRLQGYFRAGLLLLQLRRPAEAVARLERGVAVEPLCAPSALSRAARHATPLRASAVVSHARVACACMIRG
jgi:hypothetical protein